MDCIIPNFAKGYLLLMLPEELVKKINRFDWTKSIIFYDIDEDVTSLFSKQKFQIDAKNFLSFAYEDYASGTLRGKVNALSNAKRAIDCQIDTILSAFGYNLTQTFSEKIFADFVQNYQDQNKPFQASPKLKLLHAIDIAPFNLLEKLRKIRHDLEHEYRLPEKEDNIQDIIDVAELFIGYSENLLRNFIEFYFFSDTKEYLSDEDYDDSDVDYKRGIKITYDNQNNTFIFDGYDNSQYLGNAIIDINNEFYLSLLKLHIALTKGKVKSFNEAYLSLFRVFKCPTPEQYINIEVLLTF